MSSTFIKISVLTGFSLLLSLRAFYGAEKPTRDISHLKGKPLDISWAWTTERWRYPDNEFDSVEREVTAQEKQKTLDSAYIQKVSDFAQSHPTDAKAQFRWGFSILRAPYAGVNVESLFPNVYEAVAYALSVPPSPQSKKYSRLRFLLMTRRRQNSELKTIGMRLSKADPQDVPVKAYLVGYLTNSKSSAERALGLTYAKQLVHDFPRWPGAYQILGQCYENALFIHGDLAAANHGVLAFKRWGGLSTPNSPDKEAARVSVKMMEDEKRRQIKEGFKVPLVVN